MPCPTRALPDHSIVTEMAVQQESQHSTLPPTPERPLSQQLLHHTPSQHGSQTPLALQRALSECTIVRRGFDSEHDYHALISTHFDRIKAMATIARHERLERFKKKQSQQEQENQMATNAHLEAQQKKQNEIIKY